MIEHSTEIRVRYGETDQMGYIYYGNYAQYYEVGRVELIRSLGMSYKTMEEEQGFMMPVVSFNMRFVRPAHYDNLLTVKTSIRELPTDFIVFHVEIYNEKGKLCNGGSVKLCFVQAETGKRVPPPESLIEKLNPYFAV